MEAKTMRLSTTLKLNIFVVFRSTEQAQLNRCFDACMLCTIGEMGRTIKWSTTTITVSPT